MRDPKEVLDEAFHSVAYGAAVAVGFAVLLSCVEFLIGLKSASPEATRFSACVIFFVVVPLALALAFAYGFTAYGFVHRRPWAFAPARFLLGWYGLFDVKELRRSLNSPEVKRAYGLPVEDQASEDHE